MPTAYYTLVDPPQPPSPDINHVYPEVYYRVVRHPNAYPTPPLDVAAFRVAEGRVRFFFGVSANTPEGPWAGPEAGQAQFMGSERPGRNLLTPEGAILAYYADLEQETADLTSQIDRYSEKIAQLNAQRAEAEATQGAVTAAREAIVRDFPRTIPEITDERLAELALKLPLVVAVNPGLFVRAVAPANLRVDCPMVLSTEPDRTLHECGRGTIYAQADTRPTHAEIYACIDGHGEIPDTAEFIWLHPPRPNNPRVQPDPTDPRGYYARSVSFLRGAP